ncbi:MAG: hypothetical protein GEU86_01720 [Actinophytocola sp.]|nr:hypothetical protein [Actinophytocola sp.]
MSRPRDAHRRPAPQPSVLRATRVLIAARGVITRLGLGTLFDAQPGLEVVAAVPGLDDTLSPALLARSDVVFVDSALDGYLRALLRRDGARQTPAIVLLMGDARANPDEVLEFVRAGVRGVVSIHDCAEDLTQAVRSASMAATWISPLLGAVPGGQAAQPVRFPEPRDGRELGNGELGNGSVTPLPRVGKVTGAEQQILTLISEGMTDRQIAKKLARSERTVKYHVSHLRTKFRAHNRSHLVRVAIESGVLMIAPAR